MARSPKSYYTEKSVLIHEVMVLIAIKTHFKYNTWFECETESADAVSKGVLTARSTISCPQDKNT
jgi:hypothetical protein